LCDCHSLKPPLMTLPPEALPDSLPGVAPTSQDELRHFLAENFSGPKRALTPVGGGTAMHYGGPLSRSAAAIELTRLHRVVDFPARDMTVTVEAGIRIGPLAEILRAEGQRLPIDIAQSDRATLGGAIATNTSGPRRFGFGMLRDYLIGVTAMTSDGRAFHAGGRVVKNVAGYDLCKLLVGSLGTLAVISQVTLKLKPTPESSVLVWTTFDKVSDREAAVERLLTSETRPVAIETLNAAAARVIQNEALLSVQADGSALLVGFEGSRREIAWQVETLRHELSAHTPRDFTVISEPDADRLWQALINFPVIATGTAIQVNLRPSQVASLEARASRFGLATLCRAGDGILIGRIEGMQERSEATEDVLVTLADWTTQNGGSLVLLNSDSGKPSLATPSGHSAGSPLVREMKTAFDPAGLLNPGRLFPVDRT
jgi:glycolate oxidase FAD binding subunit